MKEIKNTEAPKWVVIPSNIFLAALHVLVLALSLVVHPPLKSGAARALPQATLIKQWIPRAFGINAPTPLSVRRIVAR